MQFSIVASSFLAGTIILRNRKSFEERSVVTAMLLFKKRPFVKLKLCPFPVLLLEIAVLMVGTAIYDFKEIVIKQTHEHNTTNKNINKRNWYKLNILPTNKPNTSYHISYNLQTY
jgi:hypothetical protein